MREKTPALWKMVYIIYKALSEISFRAQPDREEKEEK